MMMPTSGSVIRPALNQLQEGGSFRVRILARQSSWAGDVAMCESASSRWIFRALESRYVECDRRGRLGGNV